MTSLKKYQEKRDFSKTKEPKGKVHTTKPKKLKFVIQHHIARKDHYDLRLEYQGVYISFAVPKGLSFHPEEKRLAIHVEDHPLSYGNFEGTIPKGEYGAGTVMLFDRGYWKPYKDSKIDFKKGPVKFTLEGERMKGSWALIHFKKDNWLLIKEKDEYVNKNNINRYKTSIKTGRTMEEITNNEKKQIEITNPDKIIFKKEKVTKQDIVDYYKRISKRIMPFLENRLISTVRAPNGIEKETFYMKHLNREDPNIGKKKIKDKNGDSSYYYYLKNEEGLLSEAQMNSYEYHIWGSKQNNIKKPDILVFDLDPDENLPIERVREATKEIKKILDNLHLKSYLKTSGGKGYHIYVPLQIPSWSKCEKIAKEITDIMVLNEPEKYTTNIRKAKRKNKILIDYYRNKEGATSVAPYSLRLKKKPTISCPIYWKELDTIKPDDITIKNINTRLKKKDPWKDFFS